MIAFDPTCTDENLDPDTDLMVRVSEGERGAFDELVRRNYSSTVRIISSMMGSTSQSEDLAQDVFLRIYRSRDRYLPTAKFATFLGTIIRNTVLNAKRSLSRSRTRPAQFADERWQFDASSETLPAPAVEFDLPREIDVKQTVAHVNEAVGRLPQRQRKAIELVHFRGLSYLKAAEEMDTSSKAIKSLLGRGRATLGESLHDEYRRRFAK